MNAEQKIVQYLNEAHALEGALVQTLTAHIAMTPESEYRDLLGRHLDETRTQAERILGRLGELGESRNPVQLVYGIAQTALGQVIAAGKFPLDLLRGSGGEEKLLKNARDEAASEALEIATYDALEALATAAGDEKTAVLAREHRTQEELFLKDLRAIIPELARAVYAAEIDGDPSFDVTTTGAAQAGKVAAKQVRRSAGKAAGRAASVVEEAADTVEDAVEAVADTAEDVADAAEDAVETVAETAEETVEDAAERVSRRARETAQRVAGESSSSDDDDADDDDQGDDTTSASGGDDAGASLPIEGYDDLAAAQLLPKLRLLSPTELAAVESHERETRSRKSVLDRIEKLRSSTNGSQPARA